MDLLFSLSLGRLKVDDDTLVRMLGGRKPHWLDRVKSVTTVNFKGIGPVQVTIEFNYKQRKGISTRFGFG